MTFIPFRIHPEVVLNPDTEVHSTVISKAITDKAVIINMFEIFELGADCVFTFRCVF